MSYLNIGWSFIAGLGIILSGVFYLKSVKIEEISRVVPLIYLNPLFVLILATIFLDEIFTPLKYLGIFLLITGAILVSSKKLKFNFGKTFWFMLLSSFSLSVTAVSAKYLLNFADFWTVYSYIRFGAFFTSIPIIYFNFHDLISVVKEHGRKISSIIFLNGLLYLVGIIFIIIATSLGPATLVNALVSIETLFVFLITVFLSMIYPKILKEEIGKSTLLLKLVAIVLIVTGVFLIT